MSRWSNSDDDIVTFDIDYCCFCGVTMRTTEPTWPFCSKHCAIKAETEDDLDRSAWYYEFVRRTQPFGEH